MNNRRRLRASAPSFSVLPALALAALLAPAPAARAQAPPPTFGAPPMRPAPQAPLPTGTFLGGVPSGTPTGTAERITILDAILRALDHNLGVLTAEQALGRAQGVRWRAMADLLPNVNGRVSETRQTINLAAFGFSGGPGSPFAGIPTIVGPFNVFDARVSVTQSVLDFAAACRAVAARFSLSAARSMTGCDT